MLYKFAVLGVLALILQPSLQRSSGGNSNKIKCDKKNFVSCPKYSSKRVLCAVNPCDSEELVENDQASCAKHNHCCWVSNKCLQKEISSTSRSSGSNSGRNMFLPGGSSNDPFANLFGGSSSSSNSNLFGMNNYNLFGLGPELLNTNYGSHIGSYHQTGEYQFCPPPAFPHKCAGFPQPHSMEQIRDMLKAPIDIPYCERQACSADSNLDYDIMSCIGVPGCYYDYELSTLRRNYGARVLPGVPVCYMAIKNEKFKELAEKQIQAQVAQGDDDTWNGLFTNCFLMKKHAEIVMTPNSGCIILDMFELLGAKPKRAGWDGITELECLYIGACWDAEDNRCSYPGKMHEPIIPSLQTNGIISDDIYGQSLCHEFDIDNSDPQYLLSGYHTCKISGCSVDAEITQNTILYWLYQYISSDKVPENVKGTAWMKVLRGEIQASNYKYQIEKLVENHHFGSSLGSLGSQDHSLGMMYLQRYESYAASSSGGNQQGGNSRHSSFDNHYIPDVSNGFMHVGISGASGNTDSLESFLYSTNNFGSTDGLGQLLGGSYGGSYNYFGGFAPECTYTNSFHKMFSGSLSGLSKAASHCCKRNYCFNPKSEYHSYSGVSSYWGFWESWNSCSKSCNGGVRTRSRSCVRTYRNKACTDDGQETTQTETCNSGQCPYFENWSAWSKCSATCDRGQRSRTRVCSGEGSCEGESVEYKECNRGSCPTYTQWAAWSTCSETCGSGTRTRSRQCIRGACQNSDMNEIQDCTEYCGTPQNTKTSGCFQKPMCFEVWETKCLDSNGNPSNCREQFQPTTKRYCRRGHEGRVCSSYEYIYNPHRLP